MGHEMETGRSEVAFAACDEYGSSLMRERVERLFTLLGGPESVAAPGESVFVKVNNVIAAAPHTGIVTHPEVVRAVIERLQEVTDRIAVGDSPGGPFTRAMLRRVFDRTGITEVARQTGVELALDTSTVEVGLPDGVSVKRIVLCRAMLEADRLVSVSKLKAHRFLNVTGPIKNLYGAVPGTMKFVYHSRFPEASDFADLIVDVHLAAHPAFHVLDAVEVTEGEGARHGTLKKLGFLAASRDAFALESLALEVAGLCAEDSRVLQAAVRRGICGAGTGWFDVLGDATGTVTGRGFALPARNYFSERLPAALAGRLARLVAATPSPLAGSCTGCGKCAEICPRKAITVEDGLAVVDRRKCIRCFCCDELCESQAVGSRRPPLARLFGRRGGK